MKGIKSAELLAFLETHDAETIYLIGDIVDQWVLGKKWSWNTDCDNILRNLLEKAECGTNIIYVPGNHDEAFRTWANTSINGINIQKEAVHTTADGRRLWILHGDEFDLFMRHSRFLANLGHSIVQVLMKIYGMSYWFLERHASLSLQGTTVSSLLSCGTSKTYRRFSSVVTEEAARLGFDGVVCGHIHKAEFKRINGIEYWNDGDWVDSCTATVESMDGTMHILHYQPPSETIRALCQRASMREPKDPINNIIHIPELLEEVAS